MRFLIDVDGVVADLVGKLLSDLTEMRTLVPNIGKIPEYSEVSGNLLRRSTTPLSKEGLEAVLNLMASPGYARSLPVILGAKAAIAKIEEARHEIIWLTAQWERSPTWCYDRKRWIQEKFDHDFSQVIFADRKDLIDGDFLIDDTQEKIDTWSKVHPAGTALFYAQPWNKNVNNNGFTWADIEQVLNKI